MHLQGSTSMRACDTFHAPSESGGRRDKRSTSRSSWDQTPWYSESSTSPTSSTPDHYMPPHSSPSHVTLYTPKRTWTSLQPSMLTTPPSTDVREISVTSR